MNPFRILFMGDFSGRGNRLKEAQELNGRKPLRIDRDSIDPVMSHLNTELHLTDIRSCPDLKLEFRGLDDFHPDWIRTPEGQQPEMEPELPVVRPSPDVARRRAAPIGELTSGSLLDAAVSETEQQGQGAPSSSDPLREYVNQIVAPHLLTKSDRGAERERAKQDWRAATVREILHHHDFQKLEARWRALSLVVSRLETDESLQVFVLDLTKDELVADLDSTDDLRSTELFRVLGEREYWALVAADFAFSGTADDLEILRRLGLLCGSAGAPLIAEAEQSMLGCDSVAATPNPRQWKGDISQNAAWRQLRAAAVAQWIGLATPRFLARLPYGENATTTDSFPFEEMPARHSDYLWASPVYLCAMLIGQAFTVDEWDLRPGLFQNVSSLPLAIKQGDDGPEVLPVAEALLTEFAGDKILDLGIMPLMSLKDQDTVRLMRFQSIADPLAPLAGPWQ